MDASAVSLFRENGIPIVVFSIQSSGALLDVLKGQVNNREEQNMSVDLNDIERRMVAPLQPSRRNLPDCGPVVPAPACWIRSWSRLTLKCRFHKSARFLREPRMLSVQVWDKGQVALWKRPFGMPVSA